MNVWKAELIKLRRASAWVVVLVVPVLAVVMGTANFILNAGVLTQSWAILWGQITLFYGLFFLSLGVATLCSALWRVEHRGVWPRLMAGPARASSIVTAKLGAGFLLVAAMQVLLVLGTWLAGSLATDLDPWALPWSIWGSAVVTLMAATAVVALQSLLSMVWKSFTAPVAVCFLGVVAGIGAFYGDIAGLKTVIPQALLARAATLGSVTVGDSGALTLSGTLPIILPSLVLTGLCIALSTAVLQRRDVA